jgi:hypothetical protein
VDEMQLHIISEAPGDVDGITQIFYMGCAEAGWDCDW